MKDLKIRKDIFEAVYNCDITTDKDMLGVYKRHNIYEFAFKCKEYASNLGYQIISGLTDEQAYRKDFEKAYSEVLWYEGDDVHREYKNELFLACSEQEAIVKACGWILEIDK